VLRVDVVEVGVAEQPPLHALVVVLPLLACCCFLLSCSHQLGDLVAIAGVTFQLEHKLISCNCCYCLDTAILLVFITRNGASSCGEVEGEEAEGEEEKQRKSSSSRRGGDAASSAHIYRLLLLAWVKLWCVVEGREEDDDEEEEEEEKRFCFLQLLLWVWVAASSRSSGGYL
jgi:hypothetical protein